MSPDTIYCLLANQVVLIPQMIEELIPRVEGISADTAGELVVQTVLLSMCLVLYPLGKSAVTMRNVTVLGRAAVLF
jgi:hypothetical protein